MKKKILLRSFTTTGLYMYLKLNNNVTDSAPVPNTTYHNGTPLYVNGLYDGVANNALHLNITDIQKNFGAANFGTNFNFGDGITDQDFSLGMIIHPLSDGHQRTLMSNGEWFDGSLPRAYWFGLLADNTLRFIVFDESTGGYKEVVTTATFTSDNTYDLDAVYSAGVLYIYVDGVIATTTATTSGSYTAMETTGRFTMGKEVGFGVWIYYGYMDEITVWSIALTAEEISVKHNKYLLGQTLL